MSINSEGIKNYTESLSTEVTNGECDTSVRVEVGMEGRV